MAIVEGGLLKMFIGQEYNCSAWPNLSKRLRSIVPLIKVAIIY